MIWIRNTNSVKDLSVVSHSSRLHVWRTWWLRVNTNLIHKSVIPTLTQLKVISHPLYGMNNYVLIWGDWLSCDPLRGSHDSQSPPNKETLVPHLVATLIYLSQIYSYIRSDRSPLRATTQQTQNFDIKVGIRQRKASHSCWWCEESLVPNLRDKFPW